MAYKAVRVRADFFPKPRSKMDAALASISPAFPKLDCLTRLALRKELFSNFFGAGPIGQKSDFRSVAPVFLETPAALIARRVASASCLKSCAKMGRDDLFSVKKSDN